MEYHAELEYRRARDILDRLFYAGRFYSRDDIEEQLLMLIEHINNMTSERPVRIDRPIMALNMLTRHLRSPDPLETTQIIDRSVLEEYCDNECVICQEIPKYKDAVRTDCNHYYCKNCWDSWINTPSSNKNCPTCRKVMPNITGFKAVEVIPGDESL